MSTCNIGPGSRTPQLASLSAKTIAGPAFSPLQRKRQTSAPAALQAVRGPGHREAIILRAVDRLRANHSSAEIRHSRGNGDCSDTPAAARELAGSARSAPIFLLCNRFQGASFSCVSGRPTPSPLHTPGVRSTNHETLSPGIHLLSVRNSSCHFEGCENEIAGRFDICNRCCFWSNRTRTGWRRCPGRPYRRRREHRTGRRRRGRACRHAWRSCRREQPVLSPRLPWRLGVASPSSRLPALVVRAPLLRTKGEATTAS